MHRASGFQPIKQFSHKPKVRRNAQPISELQSDQKLKMSPWDHLSNVARGRIDVERVNYRGTIYSQPFDPRPRIHVERPRMEAPPPTNDQMASQLKAAWLGVQQQGGR